MGHWTYIWIVCISDVAGHPDNPWNPNSPDMPIANYESDRSLAIRLSVDRDRPEEISKIHGREPTRPTTFLAADDRPMDSRPSWIDPDLSSTSEHSVHRRARHRSRFDRNAPTDGFREDKNRRRPFRRTSFKSRKNRVHTAVIVEIHVRTTVVLHPSRVRR